MPDKQKKSSLSRELGEDRPIARRDFIQGVLAASAAALSGPLLKAYADDSPVVARDQLNS